MDRVWRIAGASVRGLAHERQDQPCQDACAWSELPGDFLALVVADGAGSASLAELGAALACTAVLDHLKTGDSHRFSAVPDPGFEEIGACHRFSAVPDPGCEEIGACHRLVAAVGAARAALEAEAAARGVAVRELATTLVVALAGPGSLSIAHVGDGAVIAATADGEPFVASAPGTSEYVNETCFLTGDDLEGTTRVVTHAADVTRLALITDGLQQIALRQPEMAAHGPFFAPLFRHVAVAADLSRASDEIAALLVSPRVRARADDDLTLVVAVRAPGDAS